MNQVKFSVFSDIHHYPGVYYSNAPERLKKIQQRALDQNVDFIIHCGDFCHNPIKYADFVSQYNDFSIPSYHVLGNHDFDELKFEDVIRALGMPDECYYFDKNGFRFIALNDNYLRLDGEDVPYSEGNFYKHPKERDYLSRRQVEWLREVLMSSNNINVILSHGSLSYEDDVAGDALKNREDVQNVIREANQTGHRVLLCINGHLHMDFMRIYENVCYLDMNSASWDWMKETHDYFPPELAAQYNEITHTVIYNDPIHAIITLTDDGTIEIEGMKSTFFMGVTREAASGNDFDHLVRTVPEVKSAKIKLFI